MSCLLMRSLLRSEGRGCGRTASHCAEESCGNIGKVEGPCLDA